jgi:hypothetical protein
MATKKITDLPLITALSGSGATTEGFRETLIPVVVGEPTPAGLNGTTNRITAENFSKFVNAYNATTSSNTFIGTQNVTGDVNISGRLTVREVVAQYETASILFSTGSTKLGDELTDKHEFTGSTNITGSIIVDGNLLLNGASLNNSFERIHQATGSLQIFTASQDSRNFVISQYTSSTDAHIVGISDFTSSQLIVNTGLASVTASLNNFSGSTNAFTGSIEKTTASIHLATASLNYFYQSTSSLNGFTASQADRNLNLSIVTGSLNGFTASQDDRNFVISQFTSSTDAHIVGISDFTSSQLAVNLGNSIYTASVDSHIVGISTYTSSVRDTLARVHQSTASLQNFTSSQADRNLTLSTVTGSLIGITNGLMAFTAALDNTYATDAQLYQLYQSTQSLELHSGSMVGVTNGLMAYTASNTSLNTGLRGEVDGIEAYTASLKGQAIVSSSTQVQNYDVFALNSNLYTSTGSLIGITNGLMAFTAALDSTYATDAQLFQLYQATQSLELHSGSMIGITNALMAFTAALDSTYATDAQLYQLYAETASIKAEIAGIEAYTASLKGAAIVSSSQQITNYYKFAETASANTFYGNQSVSGNVIINAGNSLRLYEPTNTNYWDTYTYTDNTLRVNYNGAGGDEIILYNDGGISFNGALTASIYKVNNGGGIDFSATSNGSGTTTSELLNDYEEGTWTGTLKGSVSDPTTPVTATGYYTKVGNKVFATIAINNATTTGASGIVSVSGLPFTSAATNNSQGSVMSTFYDFDGGTSLVALLGASTTNVFIMTSGDDADWNDVVHTAGSGRSLRFSITYFV